MPRSRRSGGCGISKVRWFPILAAAIVADANAWYSASTGTTDGDYVGVGFFAVFAFGAFRRWRSGRDRFHLIAAAGAVVALGTTALREQDPTNRSFLVSYVVFVLFCFLGSILSRCFADR